MNKRQADLILEAAKFHLFNAYLEPSSNDKIFYKNRIRQLLSEFFQADNSQAYNSTDSLKDSKKIEEQKLNNNQIEVASIMALKAIQWLMSDDEKEIEDIRQRCYKLIEEYFSSANTFSAVVQKKKPTVADIEEPKQDGNNMPWYRIKCLDFGWTSRGWEKGRGYGYFLEDAKVIYDGLVAKGNVPEVEE